MPPRTNRVKYLQYIFYALAPCFKFILDYKITMCIFNFNTVSIRANPSYKNAENVYWATLMKVEKYQNITKWLSQFNSSSNHQFLSGPAFEKTFLGCRRKNWAKDRKLFSFLKKDDNMGTAGLINGVMGFAKHSSFLDYLIKCLRENFPTQNSTLYKTG